MASQIHSRYTPAREKNSALNTSAEKDVLTPVAHSKTLDSGAIPQQRVTQTDASATYARYIPPNSKSRRNSAPNVTEESSVPSNRSNLPSLKRKHKDTTDAVPDEVPKSKKTKKRVGKSSKVVAHATSASDKVPISVISASTPEKKPNPKSERKKHSESTSDAKLADGGQNEDSQQEKSRHKSVLTKRAKSLKKSEKLARKVAETRAVLGEEVDEVRNVAKEAPELHALEPLPQPEQILKSTGKSSISALPPWLASPIRVSPSATSSFRDLGLPSEVIKVLQTKGFREAFAVQAAVLPLLLPGPLHRPGDILVAAATGSGKTLAYVLPMVAAISSATTTKLRGLIVMPTRELVTQAREICELCTTAFAFSNRRRLNIGVAVGNQTLKSEQVSLMNQDMMYNPARSNELQHQPDTWWETSDHETEDASFDHSLDITAPIIADHIYNSTPKVDILICTPGRLVEHIKSTKGFTLQSLKWLVIDEADKLLDQSFQQWLQVVMISLSKGDDVTSEPRRRVSDSRITKIVLSATMSRDLGKLNDLKLSQPSLIVLEGSENPLPNGELEDQPDGILNLPSTLLESAIKIHDLNDKPLYLLDLLKRTTNTDRAPSPSSGNESSSSESDVSDDSSTSSSGISSEEESETSQKASKQRPALREDTANPQGVLIFTKSNETAVRLSRLLTILEPNISDQIGTLTSMISKSVRNRTIREFQAGKVSIIVASDLVSRGLDLPNLAHVVNYDIPASLTSYVHRVGRTARAGRSGHAWTLFTATEGRWFWHEIARSERVGRETGNKVMRSNIDASSFTDELRQRYETALETLGQEASGLRVEKLDLKE